MYCTVMALAAWSTASYEIQVNIQKHDKLISELQLHPLLSSSLILMREHRYHFQNR